MATFSSSPLARHRSVAERLVLGIGASAVGGAVGVLLARFWWSAANPVPTCSLGPGGHCPGRPAFLPYASVGAPLGALLVMSFLWLVARSLR